MTKLNCFESKYASVKWNAILPLCKNIQYSYSIWFWLNGENAFWLISNWNWLFVFYNNCPSSMHWNSICIETVLDENILHSSGLTIYFTQCEIALNFKDFLITHKMVKPWLCNVYTSQTNASQRFFYNYSEFLFTWSLMRNTCLNLQSCSAN